MVGAERCSFLCSVVPDALTICQLDRFLLIVAAHALLSIGYHEEE